MVFHGSMAGAMHPRTLGEFRARVSFLEREVAEPDRRIEALVRSVGELKDQEPGSPHPGTSAFQ
jgi:hypothetical protein